VAEEAQREQRIAKLLARAGVGSRRDVERMIAEGRVALHGRTIASPALNLTSLAGVTVDGEAVGEAEPTRLWRYHKPRGLVVSARDEKGRETIFDRLPPGMPRVVAVGRLDLNSEGLLLLTNDGELARRLELPATGWLRRYRVRAFGEPDPAALLRLSEGVTVAGVTYGPIEAKIERRQGDNAWLTVALREGKNREVRVVLEAQGLKVNRLIRLSFGPFQLGQLAPGEVAAVPRSVLKDQLGREPGEGRPAKAREPRPHPGRPHDKPRHGQRPARTDRPQHGVAWQGEPARAGARPADGQRHGRPRHEGAADPAGEAPVRTRRHGRARHAWPASAADQAGAPRGGRPRREGAAAGEPASQGDAAPYKARRGAGRHARPALDPARGDQRPGAQPPERPDGRAGGGKPHHARRRRPPPR